MTTESADELQGVDVTITEEMIDRGVIADCRHCPVALGLNAVLEDGYRASINEVEFTIRGIGPGGFTSKVYSGATPEDARDFMEVFDARDIMEVFDEDEDVAPCTLRFELPRQLLEASLRTAVLLLLLGLAGVPAWAGPLDPRAFASLGAFPTAPGSYFLSTDGTPTLTGPGGTFVGTVFAEAPGVGVAVFDFDAITLAPGEVIRAGGALPVALLSRGDVTLAGTIDASGSNDLGFSTARGNGGPGGGSGNGYGPSGPGSGVAAAFAGGGGGFGGAGGTAPGYLALGAAGPAPGAAGGAAYGDLAMLLQGGSGAGHGYLGIPGGGGGGGLELGALGTLAVRPGAVLDADGGGAAGPYPGGGGGSGGGIFLHAALVSVALGATVEAGGGAGGGGFKVGGPGGGSGGGGGGGGGGRILVAGGPGSYADPDALNVAGGISYAGGGAGGAGSIAFAAFTPPGGDPPTDPIAVPEPRSWLPMALGLAGVMVMRRRTRGGSWA